MGKTKRYALKGINDDQTTCDICGKEDLKRVLWIVELDQDGGEVADPFACGTTCGSHMLKTTQSKMNTRANNFEAMVDRKRDQIVRAHPSYKKARGVILKELNQIARGGNGRKRLSFKERISHPLYVEMKRLEKEARDFADSQEIIIELDLD